ncbi:alpha/beta hydrolase [Lacibacter sediminis]|uniref:Alpha/beta hydrolase n=1 Tax=Lacibacter sediminis TaxID=2760713 RepID=A0A7G5XDZ8_9BACT|nr:alpha/beta hydrolase [Lacibacter sediminis]QNA43701.1 alpha/beta hydrolase [Lacibacter sediminis]
MYRNLILLLLISIAAYTNGNSQDRILYKEVDTTKLFMEVYQPGNIDPAKKYPAIVFFFGGGWVEGSMKQFEPQAKYFSQRGMICFLVDYRIRNKHQTSPFESLKDAKSAIRFIREYANRFHIDTSKIVASGGSAGGHLAAATALIVDYNESTDNLSISCVPNALALFNPVIDNGPGGYGYERIGKAYQAFSPMHNIKKGAPPTILFLGTNDNLIPVQTAKNYQGAMEKVNSRCELHLYEGQPHGFFNYKNFEYYKKTVSKFDEFLQSLGFIEQKEQLKIE